MNARSVVRSQPFRRRSSSSSSDDSRDRSGTSDLQGGSSQPYGSQSYGGDGGEPGAFFKSKNALHTGSGFSHSGGNSRGGYGQEDLRMPKRGNKDFKRGGPFRKQIQQLSNPNRKKKAPKIINSLTSSSNPKSNNNRNIMFS